MGQIGSQGAGIETPAAHQIVMIKQVKWVCARPVVSGVVEEPLKRVSASPTTAFASPPLRRKYHTTVPVDIKVLSPGAGDTSANQTRPAP